MPDSNEMRWMVMLNQARAFAEHDPHDALGRIDALLRDIDAQVEANPSIAGAAREMRTRAQTARAHCAQAYERFQAAAVQRSDAYRARIQRENAKIGPV